MMRTQIQGFLRKNWAIVGGVCLLVFTRFRAFAGRPLPEFAGDTPMYLPVDGRPRYVLVDFFGGSSRPWSITAPFAMLNNPELITVSQHIFSLVAWLSLMVAAYLILDHLILRILCIAIVLFLGSSSTVLLWNDSLLSESYTISWGVICLSGFLLVLDAVRRPRSKYVIGAGLATYAIALVAAGLVRPLLLGSLVVVAPLAHIAIRRSRTAGHGNSRRRRLMVLAAVWTCLVCCGGYVLTIDQRANYSWGLEFTGLEDLKGRSIQQLTVIGGAGEWSSKRVSGYITEIGDACLSQGFETGQYWPGIAMQCPDAMRRLAKDFDRRYVTDYVTSFPEHWDETTRHFRTTWAHLSRADSGYDLVPSFFNPFLLMVKAGDRNLVPIYVLLVGLMAITLVTMRYSKRARGCTVNLSLLAPLGLFAFSLTSLAANLLTAAVSPGDPRVAILHSTLSRATLIISLLMLVEAASKFLSRYRSTSTST